MRWAFFLAEGLTPFLDSYTIPANGLGWGSEPKTIYGANCREKDFPDLGWSVVGPLIERESIGIHRVEYSDGSLREWSAHLPGHGEDGPFWWGDDPLLAALRCRVSSKLGEEVDIPEELVSATLASVLGEGE